MSPINLGTRRGILKKGGSGGGGAAVNIAFVFTVTVGAADSFQVPTVSGGTYACNVDWGDGLDDDFTLYSDGAWNHDYTAAGAGTYTVTISGTEFTGWRFNNGGDRTKFKDVSSWGFLKFTNLSGAFYGASNMTVSATDFPDSSSVTSFLNFFYGCSNFNASMVGWDVSAATNMQAMFQECTIFNGSLDGWDTSAVTNMNYMFLFTSFNQSVSSFNTAAVTTMIWMFSGAFNQSVSNFNTAAVTNMQKMFTNNSSFNQDVSGFNTGAVTNMQFMFQNSTAFNQDVSGFNTGAVTNMANMFQNSTAFNQDVSGFDIADVTVMTDMFANSGLTQTNYDLLLVAWEGQVEKTGVTFHAGYATYDDEGSPGTARGVLVGTSSWTITDGGPD